MIKIIAGEKGKGKTTKLVDIANDSVNEVDGNIVFLDSGSQLIYRLDKGIRLINILEYQINSYDTFIGFICGLAAGNHDIDYIYLDDYAKLGSVSSNDLEKDLDKLEELSTKFDITFIIGISTENHGIPEKYKSNVMVEL